MTSPNWKDVLPSPRPGARLHEVWMTSFEQPDTSLLVEHLLPSLLGTNQLLSQEPQERNLFFGELGTTLETLRSRLTVISSPPRGPRENTQYPWIWRYVSHFNVGSETHAVQHAKLWAFHWKDGNDELLELHISSTNLTTSAFKSQLQAGWHITRPLSAQNMQKTRRTWGQLIPFLDALGASAGTIAATRLQRLIALLGRVECPPEVTIIASIPGQKSAARQLAQFKPSEIHVLTPTIGDWNERKLSAWSADVGVAPSKIHLKWISEVHPWAATSGWTLSTTSAQNLASSGIRLEYLPKDARFTEQHHDADPRWSHAKLYLLRSHRKYQLLVTSANWSSSAWGAGRNSPRNFELGVLFESKWISLKGLGKPFDPPSNIPFCVDRPDKEVGISALAWAEASWDGSHITLRARSTDCATTINALVTYTGGTEENLTIIDGEASMPWSDAERTPFTARFTQGSEILDVDVLDLRSPEEFTKTPLPEVDPAVEKALREAFLLQRYGGPAVDPVSIPGHGDKRGSTTTAAPTSDYTVQAWNDARAAFCVVDKWRSALKESDIEAQLVDRLRMDGEELRAIFTRSENPATALAAEELGWRLDKEA